MHLYLSEVQVWAHLAALLFWSCVMAFRHRQKDKQQTGDSWIVSYLFSKFSTTPPPLPPHREVHWSVWQCGDLFIQSRCILVFAAGHSCSLSDKNVGSSSSEKEKQCPAICHQLLSTSALQHIFLWPFPQTCCLKFSQTCQSIAQNVIFFSFSAEVEFKKKLKNQSEIRQKMNNAL